jgi:hypothetical protein
MVDKCPNCGQPGRPGARFCTSCGFRLPERPVEPEPTPLARSPFATTSTVASSWWPSSSPSGSEAGQGSEPERPETGGNHGQAGAAGGDVSGEEAAPMAAAETDAPAETASDAGPSAAETEPDARTEEPAPLPAWPSFPSYGSSQEQAGSSWGGTEAVDAGDAQASGGEDLAAAVAQMAGESAAEADVAPATAMVEPPPAITEEFDAPPWIEPPAAPPSPIQSGNESSASPATGEALSRAESLLDELRSLLPALAGPAPAASQTDLTGLREELARARDDASSNQTQLEALMGVVETARERPRDIDVMLDMSRHIDAIIALKGGYDRAMEAIDAALTRLPSE